MTEGIQYHQPQGKGSCSAKTAIAEEGEIHACLTKCVYALGPLMMLFEQYDKFSNTEHDTYARIFQQRNKINCSLTSKNVGHVTRSHFVIYLYYNI